MGLTYQDLLNKLEQLLEKKFSDKDTQFNDKFLELSNAISDLKRSNSQLIQVNSALLAQSSNPVGDGSNGDEFRIARDGGVACGDVRDDVSCINNVDGNEEDASGTKKCYDVLVIVSDRSCRDQKRIRK